jgi:hypothetical protein
VTGRFALYALPGSQPADTAGTALRQRAERWLGRSVTGHPVTPAVPAGWTRDAVEAITVNTRRYGFHATLKPPFRLAAGRTPGELHTALSDFAARRRATAIPRLSLARLNGFYALVPGAAADAVGALADDVVTGFDAFRAPATEAETARRDPASLTPRQRHLLTAWGYPYVLDEYRFHLTLTDRIPPERRPAVERTLAGYFADDLGATVPLDTLALFTEAGVGAAFALRAVYPLRPAAPSPAAPAPDGARAENEGTR